MSIRHASLTFNDNGTPIATDFDDLYFSDAKGLEETQYVFLAKNDLPQRWQQFHNQSFCIGETGFGTGLNFLTTLHAFEKFLAQHPQVRPKLHFISVEKFPIKASELKQALANYPSLAPYTHALLEQYPHAVAGCHRLTFLNHQVSLDLWFGDVAEVFEQIENPPNGLIDSWYLDGFAPSKNPEMWTQSLFNNMARLAKSHCQFATFTAAGMVRRGLIEAGFAVSKHKGFGRKRDMLAGNYPGTASKPVRLPYFARYSAAAAPHRDHTDDEHSPAADAPKIAIIGGGIAAANIAYALAKRGLFATVYCAEQQLAQGASGNPQGGFYPQLNAQISHASLIHAHCFSFARRIYDELLASGAQFSHQWCGTLLLAFNQNVQSRYQKMQANQTWPESLIYGVDSKRASELANLDLPYSGLYVPQAGWINPPELVTALLDAAKSQVVVAHKLHQVKRDGQTWQLNWQQQISTSADIVIFATGAESADIEPIHELPYRLVRGQVEALPSNDELGQLRTVLCHKGYFTPSWQGHHAMGSTYVKQDTQCDYRVSEQQQNIHMHQQAIASCDWVHRLPQIQSGRAAIRCSTPDHLPMVGAVPDLTAQQQQFSDLYKALPADRYPQASNYPDLYMLNGLGSRGLSTAPLCSELLASQICNQPLPMANPLLDALSPNRFLIRDLIRRQPLR